MTLAKATDDAGLTTIFTALAQQETAHAKRFEILFDQMMVEN
jgi:rubrerythrin